MDKRYDKIVLDFDNTIAMSSETIIRIKNPMLANTIINPSTLDWDFHPYAKTDAEVNEYVDGFKSPSFWKKLEVFPGFIDWLKRQYETGIPIYICSLRMEDQFTNLISWCKSHGIDEYITDYILISKQFGTKQILLDERTVIIDDNPKCFGNNQNAMRVWFNNYGYAIKDVEAGCRYSMHCLDWNFMKTFQ